jgi:enoyl-CoA hydratase
MSNHMSDAYQNAYTHLLLDRVGTDGRVGRITLNRPEKLNALSLDLLAELNEALHRLEADYDTRVIILRGAGRAFSVGYDISKEGTDGRVGTHRRTDDRGRALIMGTRTSIQQITDIQLYFWNMAKVTIAQLHGFALAGGCEFAMMADLVVAAEDTQIGHPGCRFGAPRNGNIWPLVLGMRQAKELYYTGAPVTGTRAADIGMINYAWPASDLDQRTVDYADYVANLSSDQLALLKQNMNRFYENMGIYSSVRSSTDYDAMGFFTAQSYAFGEQMAEAIEQTGGIAPALKWRDGPYQDYSAAPRRSEPADG